MIPIAVAILGAVWVASNHPFTSWREATALLWLFSVVPASISLATVALLT